MTDYYELVELKVIEHTLNDNSFTWISRSISSFLFENYLNLNNIFLKIFVYLGSYTSLGRLMFLALGKLNHIQKSLDMVLV